MATGNGDWLRELSNDAGRTLFLAAFSEPPSRRGLAGCGGTVEWIDGGAVDEFAPVLANAKQVGGIIDCGGLLRVPGFDGTGAHLAVAIVADLVSRALGKLHGFPPRPVCRSNVPAAGSCGNGMALSHRDSIELSVDDTTIALLKCPFIDICFFRTYYFVWVEGGRINGMVSSRRTPRHMPYTLPISIVLRRARWKVKIRDKETREPPHVSLLRGTQTWRIDLRTGQFMDAKPKPDEVPEELLNIVLADVNWRRLRDEWDRRYPTNPVVTVESEK